jgi:hypothetical protein
MVNPGCPLNHGLARPPTSLFRSYARLTDRYARAIDRCTQMIKIGPSFGNSQIGVVVRSLSI